MACRPVAACAPQPGQRHEHRDQRRGDEEQQRRHPVERQDDRRKGQGRSAAWIIAGRYMRKEAVQRLDLVDNRGTKPRPMRAPDQRSARRLSRVLENSDLRTCRLISSAAARPARSPAADSETRRERSASNRRDHEAVSAAQRTPSLDCAPRTPASKSGLHDQQSSARDSGAAIASSAAGRHGGPSVHCRLRLSASRARRVGSSITHRTIRFGRPERCTTIADGARALISGQGVRTCDMI